MSGFIEQGLEPLVLHLIQSGQWREAVFMLREEHGFNLSQAEAEVERLALDHGVHRYSRIQMVFVIAVSGLTLFGLAGLAQILN